MCPNATGTIRKIGKGWDGLRVRLLFCENGLLRVRVMKSRGMFCRGETLWIIRKEFLPD